MSCCSNLQTQALNPTPASTTTYNFQIANCQSGASQSRVEFFKDFSPSRYTISIQETNAANELNEVGTVLFTIQSGFTPLSSESGYRLFGTRPTDDGFLVLRIQSPFFGIMNSQASWTFTLTPSTLVQGQMCVTTGLGGPLPIGGGPVPPGCPSIIGMAYPNPDGKEICLLEYKINILGSCYEIEKSYKQYCSNLTAVLRAQSCTFYQKVLDLQVKYPEITPDSVGGYASLRLILSQIVFGHFHVQYLVQCYYPKLISKLQRSVFCNFAQLLQEEYAGYELLFQKC